MSLKIEKKLLFPTPIWQTILPNYKEINEKLLIYISELRKKNKEGILRSNILGWHSPLFELKNPSILKLVESTKPVFEEAMKDMGWDKKNNKPRITGMWSVINSSTASNERHFHPNNFLSCAYYVKAPISCGDINFFDPRDANVIRTPNFSERNLLNNDRLGIVPEEGLFVLFPSYLNHSVEPNKSNEERIVISFNFDL